MGKRRKIEVEEVSLGELTPDPENARRHTPRNIGAIVESVQAVGAARSGVVDEDGVILAGNGAAEAFGEAGLDKVLVIDVDGTTPVFLRRSGLTPEQKRKLALADNRSGELAEWDYEQLQRQLKALDESGENLLGLGWSENELDAILNVGVDREEEQPDGGEGRSGVGGAKLTFSSGQWQTLIRCLDAARENVPGKVNNSAVLLWLVQDWYVRTKGEQS